MPGLAHISGPLALVRDRWRMASRADQERIYLEEFGPAFAPLFARLPLHGAPPGLARPRFLIAVVGLSWQPVALMAAWASAERVLLVGTTASLDSTVNGMPVTAAVSHVSGVSHAAFETVVVDAGGESDIYRAVKTFVSSRSVTSGDVFIDPTGGKKSMSISAALAGYLSGAPLVYVDYAEYMGVQRVPLAGTEYPRLLDNPLTVFGDLEYRDIFSAFNRSDFREARHLAERLQHRLYEPREAECLAWLAAGYGAWDRFEFREAYEALGRARDVMDRFGRTRWAWCAAVSPVLSRNLGGLAALVDISGRPSSLSEGRPLLLWYLSAAERLVEVGDRSLAVLLTYAAVERCICLRLLVDFGLDAAAPDYDRLGSGMDLVAYHRLGVMMYRDRYVAEAPRGPLTLTLGAQLLAALAPASVTGEELRALLGLAAIRNRCVYAHGLVPRVPLEADVSRFLGLARGLIVRVCDDESQMVHEMARFRFPRLLG